MQSTIIRIGSPYNYQSIHERMGYAVFQKTNGTEISYIIARNPTGNPPSPPASVLKEFDDETTAISLLNRWADRPLPAKALSPKTMLSKYQSQAV
jgi:hypothetical protein